MQNAKLKKTIGLAQFVFMNQESIGSMRSIEIPIWAGDKFRQAQLRSIFGDAELLCGGGCMETALKG